MHIQSTPLLSLSPRFCGTLVQAPFQREKTSKPRRVPPAKYPFILPWRVKKDIVLHKRDGREVNAKILCPKKGVWTVLCEDGECAGLMWFHRGKDFIKGIPDNYSNKEYLFINKLDANYDKYKGVGTALVQALVEESKRVGLNGRVCLNATATDPKQGSPVGFYHSIGLKSVDTAYEMELSSYPGGKIPKDAHSTTMYFPV